MCVIDAVPAVHCHNKSTQQEERPSSPPSLVLQAAAYGLGVCAENGGAAFKPYANGTVL